MAFLFPKLPVGSFNFTFISNYTDLTPSGGGAIQRVDSLGSRFKFESDLKLNAVQGMGLVADLNDNAGLKVRVPVPQPFDIGTPGTPQTNGPSAGKTLKLKGVSANYAFRKGQFITVVKGGKRYLHQITTNVTASAAGLATLAIVPMLRTPLTGDETVEVLTPTIEGYLTTRELPWSQGRIGQIGVSISVAEAE